MNHVKVSKQFKPNILTLFVAAEIQYVICTYRHIAMLSYNSIIQCNGDDVLIVADNADLFCTSKKRYANYGLQNRLA